jgi:hypothetical protein
MRLLWKTVWQLKSLKKKKFAPDPTILLLGIYPRIKNMSIEKNIHECS